MRKLTFPMAVLAILAGCQGLLAPTPGVHTGTLGQSKYVIAVPKHWNGDLLMFAHGLMEEQAPLSANFDAEEPGNKALLNSGWMVAATSYRRNGVIVRDAVEDIDLLRKHIVSLYGRPKRTFVNGWSMGGAIGTMIAETHAGDYDGVLLVGAVLSLHDKDDPYRMTYRPAMPMLFLTNQSELNSASVYVRHASSGDKPVALWTVKRDGHCNVNDPEVAAAIAALVKCSQTGQIDREKDGTVSMADRPSVAVLRDGHAYGRAGKTSEGYGNIYTSFVMADLARLGVTPRSRFIVGKGDRSFVVMLATTYSDVPRGEWVAFITADGTLEVARNFENAAQTLGCSAGDEIFIAAGE